MPERSFGRSVRYQRTKLGLSQAQLGELVGRSSSSIRSWERDVSTPTDASVIVALSAILGIDQVDLFEKAGVEMPDDQSRETVEQALASLAPPPLEDEASGPVVDMDTLPVEESETLRREVLVAEEPEAEISLVDDGSIVVEPASGPHTGEHEPDLDADYELEAEVREHLEAAAVPTPPREPDDVPETFQPRPVPVGAAQMRRTTRPAFLAPPDPYPITAPTPPVVEPSYMEDNQQRQLYRVRTLATIVLVVGLVVVFLWSMSNAVEAFGDWWDSFFGSLRL